MIKLDQSHTLRRMREGASGSVIPIRPARKRVLAVTGGKGGVGKSTVAANLAVAFSRHGARTLALDGDLGMADLNLLLGLAPARSALDVLGGVPVEEVLVEAHGITLLPALNGSHRLANLDAAARDTLLAAVDEIVDRFDVVLVDTPAGIGDGAMALTSAAADPIVVATPEPLSLADAYACIKVLAMRHGVERVLVLPNAVRSPSEAEDVVARLRGLVDRFIGIEVVALPPVPFDPSVSVAAAAGVPLIAYHPDSPASRAYGRVVRAIDAIPAETPESLSARHRRRAAGGARLP